VNNPNPIPAAATNPVDQLPIPTTDPVTGVAYTPHQQFDMLKNSPEWVNKVLGGDPIAVAQKNRLDALMAGVPVAQPPSGQAPAPRAAAPDAAQVQTEVYELRSRGLTQQQAADHLRALGVDPSNIVGAGLTRPEDFRFPYTEPLPAEAQEIDTATRGWLSSAGFDAATGSHLAEMVDKLATSREWTEEAVDAHIEHGLATLRKVWGASFERNVQLIDRLVGDVEKARAGLNDFLATFPYVLTEPLVAQTLLNAAHARYGA